MKKPDRQWLLLAAILVTASIIVSCAAPTSAPPPPTQAPAQPTQAPAQPTEAPAQPTQAPAQPTQAPAQPTQAPAQPTQAPSGSKPLQGVTLTALRWAGDPWEGEYKRAAQEFEQLTGAKVNIEAIPYEGLREKEVLELSSKTGAYDLMYVHPGWFGEYVDSGYLKPIDEYMANPALNPPGFSKDKYVPSILGEGNRDGKQYSMQDFIVSVVVAYRKDLFEQAGIPEPKTWEDVLAAAEKLNKPGEIAGVAMPGKKTGATMDVFTSFLLGCGGWYFDKDGKPALDSPCAVEAAKFYTDLAKYAPEGLANYHWDEAVTAAAQGKAAMTITLTPTTAWLNDPSRSSTVGKWGFVPLAYKGKPAGVFEYWHWGIPVDSKNPEAAYQFMQWVTDGKQQAAMAPKTATGGSTQDFYADPELVKQVPVLPAMQAALSNSKPPPPVKEWPEIQDAIELNLQDAFAGKQTPEQAVKSIQAQMEKIMGK